MKQLCVSLVSLLIVGLVRADETNSTAESLIDPSSEESDPKSSEKRWAQPYDHAHASHEGAAYSHGPHGFMSRMIERAKEEKTLRDYIPMKDDFHGPLLHTFKAIPIVDSASEEEKKAPNHGSGTEFLGDLVVKGSEALSKAIQTIISVPKKTFGKISAGTTQALNSIGAFLVGL